MKLEGSCEWCLAWPHLQHSDHKPNHCPFPSLDPVSECPARHGYDGYCDCIGNCFKCLEVRGRGKRIKNCTLDKYLLQEGHSHDP